MIQNRPGTCPVHKTPLVYMTDEFYYCEQCMSEEDDDE